MWQLLPYLLKTFESQKIIYKDFFNLVKSYINFGKDSPFLQESIPHIF